ncbi:MAG: hypothetical protein JNM17_36040 [Archangium sp.]|nr:hypothetical protein [Archangium sp.]
MALMVVGLFFGKPHLPFRPLLIDREVYLERCFAGYFGAQNTYACIIGSHSVTQADFDCDDDGSAEVRGWLHDAAQFRRCERWKGGWQEISIAECTCTCARSAFALHSVEALDGGCP